MIRLDLGTILAAVMGLALIAVSLYAVSLSLQRDAARVEVARLKAEYVAADAQARRRALETEMRHAADMQALADQLTKEMQDAQKKHAGVVADLERGTVRLRKQWQGCQARLDSLPAAAETAALPDGGAELRNAGVASILRVGAECDAKLRAWQQYARTVTGAGND